MLPDHLLARALIVLQTHLLIPSSFRDQVRFERVFTTGRIEHTDIGKHLAISKQDLPDFKPSQIPSSPNPQQVHFEQYISVEVLSITDDSKTITINPKEQHILYSTELLAVVLRSKKGGLVTTELVIWKGKHCSEDGSDKIVELEKRYRTSAVFVEQGKENLQIVKALGGRLITRQVSRAN